MIEYASLGLLKAPVLLRWTPLAFSDLIPFEGCMPMTHIYSTTIPNPKEVLLPYQGCYATSPIPRLPSAEAQDLRCGLVPDEADLLHNLR